MLSDRVARARRRGARARPLRLAEDFVPRLEQVRLGLPRFAPRTGASNGCVLLIRARCGEHFVHDGRDGIAAESDVNPERRRIPATLTLYELDDGMGLVPVVEPIGRATGAETMELEPLAEGGRETAGPAAIPERTEELGVAHVLMAACGPDARPVSAAASGPLAPCSLG